jgi:hypothetical protein
MQVLNEFGPHSSAKPMVNQVFFAICEKSQKKSGKGAYFPLAIATKLAINGDPLKP